MRPVPTVFVCGLSALAATPAAADSPAPPTPVVPAATPATPTHDGVHVSFRTGLGQLWVLFGDETVSGRMVPIELSAGLVTASNLIVYGELYSASAFGIHSTYQGTSTLELLGVGPGLKRYFMPMNVFLSGSVLWSRVRFGNRLSSLGTLVEPDWGVTGRLSVGREWWIARGLGLGAAGEALVGWMENTSATGPIGTYRPLGFSLLFSASFN
jgi:hypothetical protein